MSENTEIEINPNRKYILAGDISGSMSNTDRKCGAQQRYNYMLEKFQMFVKTSEDFDKNGAPTVLLFGEKVHIYQGKQLEKLMQELKGVTFEGFTNLDLVIDKAYDLHKDEKRQLARENKVHPGTVLLVFTDGEPTNRRAVERSILNIANNIDREDEFNITFLTVGSIEPELQRYLDGLHDDLEDKLTQDFDIFHSQPLEETSFFNAVAGSLKHDREVT